MMQYSTYSVISPEGCATILWKSADKANEAAEAMGLTAQRLKELDLIDGIVDEPLGGAHRDHDLVAQNLKHALVEQLAYLKTIPLDKLLDDRYQHLMAIGNYEEETH